MKSKAEETCPHWTGSPKTSFTQSLKNKAAQNKVTTPKASQAEDMASPLR